MLDEIDVLVDGRYVAAPADRAGPRAGAGTQRVIGSVATQQARALVLLDANQPQ